jgi:hypothetical protein
VTARSTGLKLVASVREPPAARVCVHGLRLKSDRPRHASIRQRRIDTGAARLHEAIDAIERTRAGGGLNVVFTAARELRPWRNERAVQEVNDRLLTLMTAA